MEYLKIQSIHFYNFTLPLTKPFLIGDKSLENREGVIIHIISDKGIMGFGESSPLPGLSQEPLKKTIHQLERLKDEWSGIQVPTDREELLKWLKTRLSSEILSSSVCFGLESAILSLVASARHITIAEFLGGRPPKAILSAGLLQGSLQDVLAQAAGAYATGQRLFKLKVGSRNIPLDIQKIDELRSLLGADVRFRLDVNRQWTLAEALIFGRSVGKNQIDFIEEPCADISAWQELYRKTDIPMAADESFAVFSDDALECNEGIKFFIVKPTIVGGIGHYLNTLNKAHELGRRVIISGAFESGVGLTILANLASLGTEPAGLGTGKWISQDLLCESPVNPAGMILPSKLSLNSNMFHPEFKGRLKAT